MRKPWFWAGLILLAALAAMLLASLVYGGSGDREVVEKIVAEAKVRRLLPHLRTSAIHGTLQEGDARSHYVAAAKSLQQIAASLATPILADRWSEMRDLVTPVTSALRRAAFCKTVGPLPPGLSFDDAVLVNAVSLACSCLLAEGKGLEAVRVWLDAVAFSVVLHGRVLYNYQSADEALANCWTDEGLAALSEEARSLLVAGSVWAEEALLEPIDWRQYLMTSSMLALNPTAFDNCDLMDRLSAWRTGFSPQRASIRETAVIAENLRLLDSLPETWTERCKQFDAFHESLQAAGLAGAGHLFDFLDRWRLVMVARLRLLRIAVALHSGQTRVSVANPFSDGFIPVVRGENGYVLRVGTNMQDCERIVRR